MTRQTTDEEVNRWRNTPRPFEADAEDALTRLAQDFWAVTHPAPPEEGSSKALAYYVEAANFHRARAETAEAVLCSEDMW